jgi:stage IV sporulation protein B
MIVSYNETPVRSAKALQQKLKSGKDCLLGVVHQNERTEVSVKPKSGRVGVRVRDTISGIGTVTFIDPQTGTFGALGHGVTDSASGSLMPIANGFLVPAEVAEVKVGEKGDPGQLVGAYDVSKKIGTVKENTPAGIFGTMQSAERQSVAVGSAEKIRIGKAELCCTVRGGSPRRYSAEILRIDRAADNGRNLLLRITDPELLAATGGIVQGMSGSPILQDGKLIGAVTHVLVNDPKKGYGILLQRMAQCA